MLIIELKNKEDLRFTNIVSSSKKFIYPLNSITKKKFYKLFRKLNISEKPNEKKVISLGREVVFKETIIDTVFVDFNFICSYKFSPNDYIEVAENFKIFFIDNIPLLGRNKLNEIRRFIILIDILYEKKSKVYIRSEKKLLQMFDVKNIPIPFQRTISRISEMTSKEWNN